MVHQLLNFKEKEKKFDLKKSPLFGKIHGDLLISEHFKLI